MDAKKIGNAIRILRNKEGYTQQELANCLEVTDKAVSKWERGLSVPDISIINRLAIILNIDVDILLEGNITYLDELWNGVWVINNPQMLGKEIYGNPVEKIMISYFLLAGIRKITIICDIDTKGMVFKYLGDGSTWGVEIYYNDSYDDNNNTMLIEDFHFIYGPNLTKYFKRCMNNRDKITVLAARRNKGCEEKKIAFDNTKRITLDGAASYFGIPFFFYNGNGLRYIYNRNDYETVIREELFYAEPMGKGMFDHNISNYDDILTLSQFVKIIEDTSGERIYNLDDIAFNRGFI